MSTTTSVTLPDHPVLRALAKNWWLLLLRGGWYLTTSPIMTVNWLAASGQQWTVPVGGGFGRVFKLGDQPVNAQIQAFYNPIRPTGAADWQLRTTLVFLFPAK